MIPLQLSPPFHFALPPELYGIYILMILPIECGSPIRSRSFQMVRYSCSQVPSSLISSIHADRRLAPLLVFRASSPLHITTLTSFNTRSSIVSLSALTAGVYPATGWVILFVPVSQRTISSFFIVWKVAESNRLAHPTLFRESPPLWSDAVAFIRSVRQVFPLFQVAGSHHYSCFPFLVCLLTSRAGS